MIEGYSNRETWAFMLPVHNEPVVYMPYVQWLRSRSKPMHMWLVREKLCKLFEQTYSQGNWYDTHAVSMFDLRVHVNWVEVLHEVQEDWENHNQ
jgi:hypothetical protein